jgi:hypothetical protein
MEDSEKVLLKAPISSVACPWLSCVVAVAVVLFVLALPERRAGG